jgi:ABC-type uncharacterized transport system fused permease/ATPase subunit
VGDSLLLVGHNGAGKSSIFRCLGALWSVPCGKITKPKNTTDIFYIPQRPYNVMGTLADQMTCPPARAHARPGPASNAHARGAVLAAAGATHSRTHAGRGRYPDTSGAETITLEHLQSILREVDLEYLLDRCTDTDKETKVCHL